MCTTTIFYICTINHLLLSFIFIFIALYILTSFHVFSSCLLWIYIGRLKLLLYGIVAAYISCVFFIIMGRCVLKTSINFGNIHTTNTLLFSFSPRLAMYNCNIFLFKIFLRHNLGFIFCSCMTCTNKNFNVHWKINLFYYLLCNMRVVVGWKFIVRGSGDEKDAVRK